MSKFEDLQINTLMKWVTVRLGKSDIHGIGVFAIRDLSEGTKLYMDIMPEIFKLPYKKLKNNTPEYVHQTILERWPLIANGSPFVYPDARYVAYCNHSDHANYDAKNDILLCDVKAGEEITEDYSLIDGAKDIYDFLK